VALAVAAFAVLVVTAIGVELVIDALHPTTPPARVAPSPRPPAPPR
jgi:hypothetical protein